MYQPFYIETSKNEIPRSFFFAHKKRSTLLHNFRNHWKTTRKHTNNQTFLAKQRSSCSFQSKLSLPPINYKASCIFSVPFLLQVLRCPFRLTIQPRTFPMVNSPRLTANPRLQPSKSSNSYLKERKWTFEHRKFGTPPL